MLKFINSVRKLYLNNNTRIENTSKTFKFTKFRVQYIREL